MSRARSGVLSALKTTGEATAEILAGELGLTVAAVRQQLAPLQDEGLVAHRDERAGRGRPRRWYCLTPAAETLFPKRYGQLANQLLGFIEEADPGLVEEAFARRAEQRRVRAETRLRGLDFDAAVTELAAILDEDGYLARCEKVSEGFWRIAELNCAILDVARQHGSACGTELQFIRSVLTGASVERVSHLLSGGRSCSYEIRLVSG
jgi:predicted ArsR family transcriptional regulator